MQDSILENNLIPNLKVSELDPNKAYILKLDLSMAYDEIEKVNLIVKALKDMGIICIVISDNYIQQISEITSNNMDEAMNIKYTIEDLKCMFNSQIADLRCRIQDLETKLREKNQ